MRAVLEEVSVQRCGQPWCGFSCLTGLKRAPSILPFFYSRPLALGELGAQQAPAMPSSLTPQAASEMVCGPHLSLSLVPLSRLSMLRLPSASCKKRG